MYNMLCIIVGYTLKIIDRKILPFLGSPLPIPFLDLREFLFANGFLAPEIIPRAAEGQPPKGPSSLVEYARSRLVRLA